MELLENSDEEKIMLVNRVNEKKFELEEEAKGLAKKGDKILLNALVIGGTLALTYFIIRNISKGSEKQTAKEEKIGSEHSNHKENNQASLISEIGSRVAEGATLFLLNLAKDKLTEYLKSRQKENEHSQ